MRKLIVFALLLLSATHLFAHAGEVHKYMGTITFVHDDGSFMLEKTDGTTMHVHVAKTTAYQNADGSAASANDVATGKRVVVTISKDGQTASLVKIGAKR